MIPSLRAPTLPPPRRTPLLRQGSLWIKVESLQRTRSVKYRMVFARVREALERGALGERTTLVEVSSGSTGVALAYVGKRLGFPVEIHAPSSIRREKLEAMIACGANLVLHDSRRPVPALVDEVRAKAARGRCWHLDQYSRGFASTCYDPLAEELHDQLSSAGDPFPRTLVCPVGTGGLIQGVGAWLRQRVPGIRIVAVEPAEGQAIDGTRNTALQHLGEKDPYDPNFPDDVVRVARPAESVRLRSVTLGASASAAFLAAECRGGEPCLVLGPD
jgi:cysteine synthase